MRRRVAEEARHRCGYCLALQAIIGMPLHVERIIPPLFNPRTQNWRERFARSADGTEVIGQTPVGRATIVALRLNNEYAVPSRRVWVAAGWHPPAD